MARAGAGEILKSGTQQADIARVAGRGTVYITAAKAWFMVSGSAIHFVLPRLMSVDSFGMYQVVIGLVSIVNAVVITGTYQTVSKKVAEDEGLADAVKSSALKLQAAVGGAVAAGFFLLAPLLAGYLNDPRLTGYLRLASLITLAYAFYAVFTGYFNGQKKFLTQAALDMAYSTLKLIFIVGLVAAGLGVAGGVGGFAMAAASILAISAVAARGRGSHTGEVRIRKLFQFQIYLLLFTLVLNLLQKVDLLLIKALSSTSAVQASENAAFYGASVNVANITYQVIISVTFVLFPLISRSSFENDRRSTQVYVSNALKYVLMIMALVATLFSANASEVLGLIYRAEYQAGSVALAIIAYGMLAFGLLQVLTTIISASGRPGISLCIAAVTLAVNAALNFALVPTYGLGGAATATTVSMFLGAAGAAGFLMSKYGLIVEPWSVIRISICAGGIYGLSRIINPNSKALVIGQLLLLGCVYLAGLIASGELGKKDLASLRKIIKT